VFLEHVVEEVANADRAGSKGSIEGPFYIPGAPSAEGSTHLPMRPDEPGERLTFTGAVRATSGEPLAGAVLDVWQADGSGLYSRFAPGLPEWNLRGRVATGADGRFAIGTVVPLAYDIPGEPHTARVLEILGLEPHRPAHIHVKVEHAGYAPLTTQVYFAGDQWLEHDVVGAARPSLVTKLEPGDAGFVCQFDFTLAPAG